MKSNPQKELTTPHLHLGRLPDSPIVLAEIQSAHRLGFRTVMKREYDRLIAHGFEPDQFGEALAAGWDLI